VRRVLKVVLPLALLAGSLLGAGWLRATKPEIEPSPAHEQIWTVSTQTVRFADHQPVLQLYGEVVAGREVTLRPLVAGEVVRTSDQLVEGGRFATGELVTAIDSFDYRARRDELKAEAREARAKRREVESTLRTEWIMLRLDEQQLELTERDLARRERLRGSQAASEKAEDDARLAVARQEAALAHRRQTIATLEARLEQQDAVIARLDVAVERAERDLAHTELRAPFAGFVTEVSAAIGKRLGIGDPIAQLIDEARLEIRFNLSDADFGRLWQAGLIGRELEARWRLGPSWFTVAAKVARVEPTIDPASGGVEVFAEVTANPADAPLRPGAFVEVLLPDRLYHETVELPASALFHGNTVYAVADERLEPKSVEVVAQRGANVLVRGALAPGDAVVTSRLAEIGPGLKVRVAE
jgi:multidrug efflux system membrane fusion protein